MSGANPPKEFSLAVLEIFRDHRAVQIKVDRIDRHCARERAHEARADAFEGVAGDQAACAPACPDEWCQVVRRAHLADESGHREAAVFQPRDDVIVVDEGRAIPVRRKIGEIGLGQDEAVRLVMKAADCDACHGSSSDKRTWIYTGPQANRTVVARSPDTNHE